MSKHDRIEEGFRALRAATEAGLHPPGTVDAVMRYRKRRARRAVAISLVAIAALSVALQGSPGSRHPRQEVAASPSATAAPSLSSSPSASESPQATVTSPQPAMSTDAGSRTAKPPQADCVAYVGMVIRSTTGGYNVGVLDDTSYWRNGPCAAARIGIFWAVYPYSASGPRPRSKSGMQYVTLDSPYVFIPFLPKDECQGDSWVIASGPTIPAAIPASVTSRDALHAYVNSVGDHAIVESYTAAPCAPSPTTSP